MICGLAAVGGLLMALLGPFGQWLLVAAAVFGAGSFAVYPAVVAHLIDHLHQEDILSGNAALLMLHGLGAAIGPALAGVLMSMTAPVALPLFFTLMFALCALYALWQLRQGRDRIVDEAAHYIPMVRTSNAVLEMMLEDATHEDVDPAPSAEAAETESPADVEGLRESGVEKDEVQANQQEPPARP